jgi:hypothetical protein
MPVVRGLNIGLLPLLQLTLLSPLVFWLATMPAPQQRANGRATTTLRDQVSVWLLGAVALGLPLFVADHDRRPLDDPDLVFQRPGFLDPHGTPFAAPRFADNLPSPGRRAVVFFVRPEQAVSLSSAISSNRKLLADARLAAVLSEGQAPTDPSDTSCIVDSSRRLAERFPMRRPRDGGPPVGYAIVDSSGLVRYTTLDPGASQRLKEVRTMLAATP